MSGEYVWNVMIAKVINADTWTWIKRRNLCI